MPIGGASFIVHPTAIGERKSSTWIANWGLKEAASILP